MATTTISAIRTALVARVEALTPTTAVRQDRGQAVFRQRGGGRARPPGIWALEELQQPNAADDRTFLFRFGGGMRDTGATSQVERRTMLDAEMALLYYWPADDQADDLDLRIQQDALDIDKDLTDWLETGPLAGLLPTTAVTTDQPPTPHASGAALVKRIGLVLDFWRAG